MAGTRVDLENLPLSNLGLDLGHVNGRCEEMVE